MEPHAHSHNPPLGWSYGSPSATCWPPAPTVAPVKRPLSESDDCDDVFSEKEQCTSPGDADSCQMLSRKKRRGVIEKKRRDRINTSLTELKRLVPSAYEKQGSAKLEKAEILQMTVDHLKMIHAKGLDVLAYDPHKFAMDYHNIGFRECASEVARYLVTIEGMDIQDPLRLRLMSHLQCFAAQRELASKQAGTTTWGYAPTSSTQAYPALPSVAPPPPVPPVPVPPVPVPPPPPHQDMGVGGHFDIATSQPAVTVTSTHHHYQHNLNTYSSPGGATSSNVHNYNQSSSTVKPYRPWGAELAY